MFSVFNRNSWLWPMRIRVGDQLTPSMDLSGVDVSMDGRGWWMDDERLWRSVKRKAIYVQDYGMA